MPIHHKGTKDTKDLGGDGTFDIVGAAIEVLKDKSHFRWSTAGFS